MLYFRKYLPSFVLIITIMISGLYTSSAFSADYAWRGYLSQDRITGASSVEAACTAMVGVCGTYYSSSYRISAFAGSTQTNATSWSCKYQRQNKDASGNWQDLDIVTTCNGSQANAFRSGDSCPSGTTYNSTNGSCDAPPACPGDSVRQPDGSCVLDCPLGSTPNATTQTCDSICEAPQHFDFESESCKYPEDELCPTGSNWDPVTQDCVCDGAGILSNSSGFRLCMQPADDSCSSESADFVGYINGTKPYCSGRARCASGSVPGTVTVGGVTEYVCVPSPQEDPKCPNGTMGNYNGETVCIPKPNTDPNCPSGQSGTVDGQTVCIPKPGDPGGCAAGETPGFAGTGAEMNAICVPADYKPQTCPAGQYAWNSETDGFACVTIPSTPTVGDDGGPTGPGQGGSGDNTATGTVVTKNPDGTVKETSEIELKLPDGLLQDQPQNNYFTETDEFGDSQLEKLDADTASILSDFSGADGAFTQRNSLQSASDRLLGLFGYSTSCSGDLIFYQSENRTIKASCEKLNKMRELLGWFLYVSTLMGIYNILMQKQEN